MGIAYNRTFVDDAVERMSKIDDDTKPLWGSMSAGQMRAHLQTALRYSLGKEKESPDESTFMVKYILCPILLSGLMKLPKNVARPAMYDAAAPTATLDEVKTELDEILGQVEKGAFEPPAHPSLGDLGPTRWGKLHNIHFDHHLRQFGV